MGTSKYSQLTPTAQCLVEEQADKASTIINNHSMSQTKAIHLAPEFAESVREGLSNPDDVARLKQQALDGNALARINHTRPFSKCVP
jgi:hypothetical protein